MDAKGLTAVDSTDVLRGNEDIADSCAWEPPTASERAGLPGREHLQGVEWEPLPKPKWLTENRSFAIAGAFAVVGMFLGVFA